MLRFRLAAALVRPFANTRPPVVGDYRYFASTRRNLLETLSSSNGPSHILQRPPLTTFARLSSSTSLLAKKPAYSERQLSLVVHGPEGFQYFPSKGGSTQSKRPFKLVIVESPSKCATIAKILTKYVQENNLEYDFVVTSCMGHVRNLTKKKTSKDQTIPGIDLNNGYQPIYEMESRKITIVKDLQLLSQQAQQIILATDDDREGEAMAWHLLELLFLDSNPHEQQQQQQQQYARVRFTEITPKAIVESIENQATTLRDNLVQAQETRRILDRLAGFTVSPVLWKKIAPGLSAGRVQSVGMALVVQRERERMLFQETEYWDLEGSFCPTTSADTEKEFTVRGQLVSINGTQLAWGANDFESRQANTLTPSARHKLHLQEQEALELASNLQEDPRRWKFVVSEVTSTKKNFNPPPPLITSTLQQEANSKLGLSVSNTMSTAQKLYENGFISYMRTDSDHLSNDAIAAIQSEIVNDYGGIQKFQQRRSSTSGKKKNSKAGTNKKGKPEPQAAHEAIRPAIQPHGLFAKPSELGSGFSDTEKRLYELIYQRAVASFMIPQIVDQTSVRIEGKNGEYTLLFKAAGSVVVDPGFTAVYPRQSESKSILPPLVEGQKLDCEEVAAMKHSTNPPPRYTEASFVKELEALGVGRPSTYASVVQILRDRGYVGSPKSSKPGYVSGKTVSLAQRAAGGEEVVGDARGPLVPSLSAFVVCSLLENHCPTYVDPSFTARMEERLDIIANSEESVGNDERVAYLDEFYAGEGGLAAQVQRIDQTVEAEEARRANLPGLGWNVSAHDTNLETRPDLALFIGPWGPYVQKLGSEIDGNEAIDDDSSEKSKPRRVSLPGGMAADLSSITPETLNAVFEAREKNGVVLGEHPQDGRNIRIKLGRFGAYLQLGEDNEEGTTTHTLPLSLRTMDSSNVSGGDLTIGSYMGIGLEEAIQYVDLPRKVCDLHESPIIASIGPYGAYLKYNSSYVSIPDDDVLTIDSETAVEVVTEGIINKKSRLGRGVLAEIGEQDGSKITVKSGRFGMYLNWKKVNAKMPSEYVSNPTELPFEEAWSLICEKAETVGSKSSKSKGKNVHSVNLPPAPKRPLSAYLHFCADKRAEVAAKSDSLGATTKELARLWKETSEDERAPYMELAQAAKESYLKEEEDWKVECQQLLKTDSSAKSKRVSSADLPKRPRSAYLFFCADKRKEIAEQFSSLGEVTKELARLWSEATASERKGYEDLATADKLRYEEEKSGRFASTKTKTSIKSAGGQSKKTKIKSVAKRKIKNTRSASGGRVAKRAPSAYILFCSAHRNAIVDENGDKLSLGETTKRLAEMWKACDEETRARFEAESQSKKEELLSV